MFCYPNAAVEPYMQYICAPALLFAQALYWKPVPAQSVAPCNVPYADIASCTLQDPANLFLATTEVIGTALYMAPEQLAGHRCNEKCDVFALATILNECATRRRPWAGYEHPFQVRAVVRCPAQHEWGSHRHLSIQAQCGGPPSTRRMTMPADKCA